MKKEHLAFGFLPKMNGRNSRSKFAAYRTDGNRETPEQKKAREDKEESDFQEAIKDLDEAGKASLTVQRKQLLKLKAEFEAGMISKEEHETEMKAAKEANKSENAELQKQIDKLHEFTMKQAVKITGMKNGANGLSVSKSFREQIADEVSANKEALVAVGKGFGEEVTLKANTVRASIATNIESTRMMGIGQLGVKERSLYDEATKIPLSESDNSGQISYIDWDESTTVRAAAAVAEGGTFAESTAKFKNYQVLLKKIGDTLPVSTEFFEDEARCAAELERFLEVNVDAEVDRQLIVGDGTSDTMTGLISSTPEWTPTAYGIADANVYDLIQKMTTAITKNRGSKYKRERIKAVMNSDTYDLLVLKKDDHNNYQFPPNHPIYSRIVIDNNMADDKMVVGDLSYIYIYEKPGITISKGEINAQFTADMMTLKARTRKLMVIRTADQTGFLRLSTSGVAAAINTIQALS